MSSRKGGVRSFVVLFSLSFSGLLAAGSEGEKHGAAPYQQTAVLPALPGELVEASRAHRDRRLQIGIRRDLEEPLAVDRTRSREWTRASTGQGSYRMAIAAPGARGVRIQFDEMSLPAGTRILLADAARPGRGERALDLGRVSGEVWSPTLFTDAVEIRCEIPPGVDPASVEFKVKTVSYLYSTASEMLGDEDCSHDVACYDEYNRAASAVGLITYVDGGNTYVCSGSMIEGPRASASYFLTANHCVYNQQVASSLEFFWLYQAQSCGGADPGLDQVPSTSGGAELLANSEYSDFSLVRPHRAPPGGVGRLSWTLDLPQEGDSVTCIHHPQGGRKRISFGTLLGETMYFWPVHWNIGVTQPGSSGSPLLNDRGDLIGILSGGFDGPGSSCEDPDSPDEFGRFDVAYATAERFFSNSGGGGGGPATGIGKALYDGLFYDPNGAIDPASVGAITIKTTDKGKFSGKAFISGAKAAFSGTWDSNGESEVLVRRRFGGQVILHLSIDPQDPSEIQGALSDDVLNAEFTAYRVSADRTRSLPQAGQYTLILPGETGSDTLPGGESYGTVKVDVTGKVRFAGSLADGTKVSQAGYVSEANQWGLYIPVYGGRGLLFSAVDMTASSERGLNGNVVWLKPQYGGGNLYPQGFYFETSVQGSRYQRPPKGQSVLPQGEALLVFDGPEGTITNPLIIGPGNRVANSGDNKVTLKFSTSTGLFSGVFTASDSGARIRFGGAVLQSEAVAYGYFPDDQRTGAVTLHE